MPGRKQLEVQDCTQKTGMADNWLHIFFQQDSVYSCTFHQRNLREILKKN